MLSLVLLSGVSRSGQNIDLSDRTNINKVPNHCVYVCCIFIPIYYNVNSEESGMGPDSRRVPSTLILDPNPQNEIVPVSTSLEGFYQHLTMFHQHLTLHFFNQFLLMSSIFT